MPHSRDLYNAISPAQPTASSVRERLAGRRYGRYGEATVGVWTSPISGKSWAVAYYRTRPGAVSGTLSSGPHASEAEALRELDFRIWNEIPL